MRDISTQLSAQGTAVGCRSTLISGPQTHPNNEEPQLWDRIYGKRSNFWHVGGNQSA